MKISPAKFLSGSPSIPGDKSISHRAAMLLAIAEGSAKIKNFSTSADCASTLSCLADLGVKIERTGNIVSIAGSGKKGLQPSTRPLDCGNSGTSARLLAGILAGQNFESVLTGDDSLSKRPMQRIIEPLERMGANLESDNGGLPLRIVGRNPLQPIEYSTQISSAQVKSCVLLAGINTDGRSVINTPMSRNHTELMLRYLGADIEEPIFEADSENLCRLEIDGGSNLTARDIDIPSDISSAAFFMVGAACLPGSEVVLKNIGLNPTRTAVIELLQHIGADIEIFNTKELCNEIRGDVKVRGGLKESGTNMVSIIIKGETTASLIDEIPILAVLGTQLRTGLEIRDARELRYKESDRINAIVENLRRLNARVEEYEDGFHVYRSDLSGGEIDSFGDHRVAMAFSIAGLFAKGETFIKGADCAAISYPNFFADMQTIVR